MIRDVLEHDGVAVMVKERELRHALAGMTGRSQLVVTDTSAYLKAAADTPPDVLFTSFSFLMEMLAEDILLLKELDVEMAGIGPFIPHPATPLGACTAGSLDLTLKVLAVARLLLPLAHLPATTAVAASTPPGGGWRSRPAPTWSYPTLHRPRTAGTTRYTPARAAPPEKAGTLSSGGRRKSRPRAGKSPPPGETPPGRRRGKPFTKSAPRFSGSALPAPPC